MTQLLVKSFIKDSKNISDMKVRAAYGRLAGWTGIVCNLFLFAGKLMAGLLSGSVSVTADAVNNLSDASSSIISLLGFKMASKPADNEHPYGHARYEYLSGLLVALLILVIGVELLKSSVGEIIAPSGVDFSWLTFGILLASVLVKLWMALFNKKIGKAIDSQAIIATAADCRNDVISTLAVLLGNVIALLTKIELDGWMGTAVALFILYSGVGLVKDTISPLLGNAPDPELVKMIEKKIMSYEGVLGTHDLMVHDYGPGRQFASVHVEMAAEGDVLASHDVIDNIERDFKENDGIHMMIHFDPIVTKDDVVSNMRLWLAGVVQSIDTSLSIHDFRMVPGRSHTNLIFDCVVPPEFKMTGKEVKEEISKRVSVEHPDYYCVITIDTSYVSVQ